MELKKLLIFEKFVKPQSKKSTAYYSNFGGLWNENEKSMFAQI